jgi:aspartate carbamoyltransferase catalytic subunit
MAYQSFEPPSGRFARNTRRDQLHKARNPKAPKHLLSASVLTVDDVDELCQLAYDFEIGRATSTAVVGRTIALLFFQSSTRTRLGFESAAVSLGAHAIGMEDMSSSRTNSRVGESLEDCAAVVSRLSDAIVVRHHEPGAAARMAAKSVVPVINAGDGWNEHPTQALIDIYAMRRGLGSIRGKSIAYGGDPRGRVVRSLMRLLSLEGPREIMFCPPPHYEVPGDVLETIAQSQIACRIVPTIDTALTDCDAIVMAPYDMTECAEPATSDFISPHETALNYTINAEKIERLNSKAQLYHPLPRFDEIDPSCDDLPNAMYFEQVRLSRFMRMAVLDRLLSDH